MSILLVIVALLSGFGGLLLLSQATTGVGIICWACLVGVLARIAQASEQHKELKQLLERPK